VYTCELGNLLIGADSGSTCLRRFRNLAGLEEVKEDLQIRTETKKRRLRNIKPSARKLEL
jgi:hypothetical protein